MEYITVFATTNEAEIAFLKSLFESKGVDHRITGNTKTRKGNKKQFIQIAEKDRALAREILHESGYLNLEHQPRQVSATRGKKWMFILLAVLVLVLVAILIAWFMNATY